MAKDSIYRYLIQSRRWRLLRNSHLSAHPLCERCLELDRLRSATEVHHIDPIENGHGVAEKTRRAFDPTNLKSLCHECHVQVHKEMFKGTKREARKRTDKRVAAFLGDYFGDATPGG